MLFLGFLIVGITLGALGYHEKSTALLGLGGLTFILLGLFIVAEGITYTSGTRISINQTNYSTGITETNQTETLLKTTYRSRNTTESFGLIMVLAGFFLMLRGLMPIWERRKVQKAQSDA